jgi:hypothetical protein
MQADRSAGRAYVLVLGLLLLAFVFRVISQLVQLWRPVRWLPPFEAWHSGALPYPILVAAQLVIIIVALWCMLRIERGVMRPKRAIGQVLLVLGWIYFAGMALRLVLGLSLLHHIRWFDAPLPSFFHLVLASMVLTLARFHLQPGQDSAPRPDRRG